MKSYLFLITIVILILYFIFIITTNGYILTTICNFFYWVFELHNEDSIPYYDTNNIDWCNLLRDNWKIIYEEYYQYSLNNKLKRFSEIDPVQNYLDTTDIPWEVVLLKAYNSDTKLLKHFPKTRELLLKTPCSYAMFSVLKPGKILAPHHGPYKGVLRYHLCIKAPSKKNTCFIKVKDEKYIWSEGEDVMFDDTLLHSAENLSSETRVVLFLDIPRTFNNNMLNMINKTLLNYAKYNTTIKNMVNKANE